MDLQAITHGMDLTPKSNSDYLKKKKKAKMNNSVYDIPLTDDHISTW